MRFKACIIYSFSSLYESAYAAVLSSDMNSDTVRFSIRTYEFGKQDV